MIKDVKRQLTYGDDAAIRKEESLIE